MTRLRKLLILIGIIVAALVAAIPFLRRESDPSVAPKSPASSDSNDDLRLATESAAAQPLDLALITEDRLDLRNFKPTTPPAITASPDPQDSVFDRPEEDAAFPELPEEFSAAVNADDDRDVHALSPTGIASSDGPASESDAASVRQVVSEPTTMDQPPRSVRRYVVRDGDSLEALADRLLGDVKYAEAIYQLNKQKLSRRDLLPIGVELLIPEAGR
ncbi:MAG: LysM domain-containing protein [Pirellulaceae bacterium]